MAWHKLSTRHLNSLLFKCSNWLHLGRNTRLGIKVYLARRYFIKEPQNKIKFRQIILINLIVVDCLLYFLSRNGRICAYWQYLNIHDFTHSERRISKCRLYCIMFLSKHNNYWWGSISEHQNSSITPPWEILPQKQLDPKRFEWDSLGCWVLLRCAPRWPVSMKQRAGCGTW